jgi:hypothetical protein
MRHAFLQAVALVAFSLTISTVTRATCSGNWGTALATYRSVTAYSNGPDPGCVCCSGTYGYQYQCVEYVKRFYSEAMHFSTTGWSGDADSYFGSAEAKGLRVFNQGGTIKPEPNDILCFSGGEAGHVGIIMAVGSNYADMIDQNRSSTSATIRLPMSVNNGQYTVSSFSGSYPVQGWLRGYTCDFDHQSPNVAIFLAPGQEHEFKVYYGNTSRPNAPHWRNDGGNLSIELGSCNSQGVEASCFLYPVPGRPSWLDPTNRKRIIRMTQADVGTDGIAEFSFWGKPPEGVNSGLRVIYFRPYHSSGQWIEQWEGMSFSINVDADAPQAPPGLVANPSTCSANNSFTFNWAASSDPGSGVEGYAWKVNGEAEAWTTGYSAGPRTAPNQGWNTFYVRAKDWVGNWSGYSSVQFCWLPPNGPNLSFEDDVSPQDGVPDGWTVLVLNGAGYDRRCNGGANNTSCYMRFANYDSQDWSAIGRPASGVFQSGIIYRLSFWYRTSNSAAFSWQLSTPNLQSSINVLNATVSNPLADDVWHHFWGAPFMVSGGQISDYPFMRFLYGSGIVGVVDIDDVVLEEVTLCQ